MVTTDGGVDIGILGPLELRLNGEVVTIGRQKQRALLALLVVNLGRTVSIDRMIDELWDGEPPAKAISSLQAYVSNLRRLLEPVRTKGTTATVLVTQPPGYRLAIDADRTDAARFETLAAASRAQLAAGDALAALDIATEALALWRGNAFDEFRYDGFADTAAARLEELRRACEEDRLAATVQLGLHATAIAELDAAVRNEPLRERRWALLMRALYGAGRHAEALERFQQLRRLLRDELGLDPSPEMLDLERMVLSHDPALGRSPRTAEPQITRAPQRDADTARDASEPGHPHGLIERDMELRKIDATIAEVSAGVPRILVVEGPAGTARRRSSRS